MNEISFGFGTGVRKQSGTPSNPPNQERPLEAAWMVLEAANDLGDQATVEVCRRVIDADLNGVPASGADLHIVLDYFR